MYHMGPTCAIWKPYGSYVLQVGDGWCQMGAACAVWELYELYGTCTPWETDGTIWEPHGMYGGHIKAVCTVWEPCATYWRWMAPIRRHLTPLQCHLAPIRCTSLKYGAHSSIWPPYDTHITNMAPFASCMLPSGSHTFLIKCTWLPCSAHGTLVVRVAPSVSYGSHMGAIWKPCTPSESCRRCGV
jgi:hypothetical protein